MRGLVKGKAGSCWLVRSGESGIDRGLLGG